MQQIQEKLKQNTNDDMDQVLKTHQRIEKARQDLNTRIDALADPVEFLNMKKDLSTLATVMKSPIDESNFK